VSRVRSTHGSRVDRRQGAALRSSRRRRQPRPTRRAPHPSPAPLPHRPTLAPSCPVLPRSARPALPSPLRTSLPAAFCASRHHLRSSQFSWPHSARSIATSRFAAPGRVPRVPSPRRSSQFSWPRSARPAPTSLIPTSLGRSPARPCPVRPSTTSRCAVLATASRASRHHLALRAPGGRVPCVPPMGLVRRTPCASGGGTWGAVRVARRALGRHGAGATGARREEDPEGARRRGR
jgi:hypothetical protein